ncbi:AEC family transporter [Ancylobacter oerskovii]|uniref:AEC family transporter n=1 Tax=Ancylobacter oerskovii TaxID=459519 RepID=A0ABW4Z2I1_9HYPH|nr:AEC family transporter [Ancylobacter oerskovii]MBS7544788.1 AEC family transporter [Ancylobacter oerskovii]
MAGVLGALIPVFLIIALGAVLRRTLLTDNMHWVGMEKLTYYILFPSLIVISIARADLGGVAVIGVSTTLFISIAGLGLALILLRLPLSRRLALASPSFTSLFQASVRWNSYVALAVSGGMAGPKGLAVSSVGLAVMIPLLNIMSVAVLARHGARSEENRSLTVFDQVLRNPYVWSCAAGGLLHEVYSLIPPVLISFVDILGRSSLALGLLVVGAGLRIESLHRPRAATLVSCIFKLAVLPAIAVSLGYALGLREENLLVIAIVSSVPTAPNGYVLARQMGGDVPLLAEMLTIQSLLAAITMPLVVYIAAYII